GHEHTNQPAADEKRECQDALRVRKPREWNLGLEVPSGVGRFATDRTRVAHVAFEAREAKRPPFAGDGANQSFAQPDFGPDAAFAVAIARECDKPASCLVPQQHARVCKLEVFLERFKDLPEQRLEIAGAIDSLRDELESADLRTHAINRYVLFR